MRKKSNWSSGNNDSLDFEEQLFQSSLAQLVLISTSANSFLLNAPYSPHSLLTIVNGMNCRMLPRLPCSRHSTDSSMKLCTNWVWGPAILEPTMDETSRNKLAEGNIREEASERLHGARENRFIRLSHCWCKLWCQTIGSNGQNSKHKTVKQLCFFMPDISLNWQCRRNISHLELCWEDPSCWQCAAGTQRGSCSWSGLLWQTRFQFRKK